MNRQVKTISEKVPDHRLKLWSFTVQKLSTRVLRRTVRDQRLKLKSIRPEPRRSSRKESSIAYEGTTTVVVKAIGPGDQSIGRGRDNKSTAIHAGKTTITPITKSKKGRYVRWTSRP